MDDGFRVFVVDDDILMLEMVSDLLGEDCRVESFLSGNECLERLQQVVPDMFLLDVSMPVLDGYALCRQLKSLPITRGIPVTFISANDTSEARLQGYEAGGEDFITKPFSPDELLRKVLAAQRIVANKRAIQRQIGSAAFETQPVISSLSELNVAVGFMRRALACNSPRELAEALVAAMHAYGLQGAVQLRACNEVFSLSGNGPELPLEVSVLNHVRTAGRLFQFKSRCVFNYDHVTLMLNNMPVDDADHSARIRENCALIAEMAEGRLLAIEAQWESRRRQTGVAEALPKVHAALDSVQANYRRNCFQLTALMSEFREVLEKSFLTLGLEVSQEAYLTELAQDYMQRMVGAQDESLAVVGQLEQLASSLGAVAKP